MESGVNLREEILRMYRDNYHGGRMKLVVIGGGMVIACLGDNMLYFVKLLQVIVCDLWKAMYFLKNITILSVHVCVRMCMHAPMCMCICASACVCTSVRACVHRCAYARLFLCVCLCMLVSTHITCFLLWNGKRLLHIYAFCQWYYVPEWFILPNRIFSESLDVLEDWVVELFGKVKAGPPLKMSWKIDMPAWKAGKLYKLEAVKDVHILDLTWTLPCLHREYLKKPEDYLAHLVGHGKASNPLVKILCLRCI